MSIVPEVDPPAPVDCYGAGVEGKEATVLDPDAGLRRAEALLGAGLPIDLDAGACRAHAEECARLVELLGPAHPARAATRASRAGDANGPASGIRMRGRVVVGD